MIGPPKPQPLDARLFSIAQRSACPSQLGRGRPPSVSVRSEEQPEARLESMHGAGTSRPPLRGLRVEKLRSTCPPIVRRPVQSKSAVVQRDTWAAEYALPFRRNAAPANRPVDHRSRVGRAYSAGRRRRKPFPADGAATRISSRSYGDAAAPVQ